jgi:hypothetical protein
MFVGSAESPFPIGLFTQRPGLPQPVLTNTTESMLPRWSTRLCAYTQHLPVGGVANITNAGISGQITGPLRGAAGASRSRWSTRRHENVNPDHVLNMVVYSYLWKTF